MSAREIQPGDLVDAEYVDGIGGTIRLLQGIVTHASYDGIEPTRSVYGVDAFGESAGTSSSTMPVHLIAERSSQDARDHVAHLMAATATTSIKRRRLAEIQQLVTLEIARSLVAGAHDAIDEADRVAEADDSDLDDLIASRDGLHAALAALVEALS